MAKLNLMSLNTNGLLLQQKRRAIFKKCREGQYDFCFLQETHSTPGSAKIWEAEWGGPIWFAHGTSNSRGVAILGRKGADFQMSDEIADTKGRYLLIKAVQGQNNFTLGCIYAPTQDHYNDQVEFIEELEDKIVPLEPENLILGGDFNICMEQEQPEHRLHEQKQSIPRQNTCPSGRPTPRRRLEITTPRHEEIHL